MADSQQVISPLRIDTPAAARIAGHCLAEYPREACGLLIGVDQPGDAGSTLVRVVQDAIPSENVWADADEHHRRFTIDPSQQLAVERSLEGTGRAVVGFYHSHPDHPAVPSAFDTEAAWPFYTYVIASVCRDSATLRAWRLDDSAGAFVEQRIEHASADQ
jgi:proteasome lid subunit RPN8/RPN11